jgi:hypothetical protein
MERRLCAILTPLALTSTVFIRPTRAAPCYTRRTRDYRSQVYKRQQVTVRKWLPVHDMTDCAITPRLASCSSYSGIISTVFTCDTGQAWSAADPVKILSQSRYACLTRKEVIIDFIPFCPWICKSRVGNDGDESAFGTACVNMTAENYWYLNV